MRSLEGRKTSKRRALDGAIPDWAFRHHAAPLQPLPQAGFELDLEVIRVGKALMAGGVVAFRVFGPAFPHCLQQLRLLDLLGYPFSLVDDRRRLAEQVDVRHAV